MTFTFLGAYDPDYPHNALIRKGLRQLGMPVAECRVSRKFKFWARYPLLLLKLPLKVPRRLSSAPRQFAKKFESQKTPFLAGPVLG